MPLTVGTAGHIDHGKTWLVRALTGKDTDRLPEEQERGISIDLGYAPLELPDGRRLSLIDVPGHERFVRTMVAGATGIDLFLLVIDAGEGARPQTHEHLAILRLLGIERGVVAVTKADAVDAETLELALEEARELVPEAEAVAVSAKTGEGLDELRAALARAAVEEREPGPRPTRLFVDRVFTLRGIGTVATGTLWSGSIGEGTPSRAEPAGLDVRVRSVQVHDRPVDRAEAGQRVAVALPGVERGRLHRGRRARRAGRLPAELPPGRSARRARGDPRRRARPRPPRHGRLACPRRPRRRALRAAAARRAGRRRPRRSRRDPERRHARRRARARPAAAAPPRSRAARAHRARRRRRNRLGAGAGGDDPPPPRRPRARGGRARGRLALLRRVARGAAGGPPRRDRPRRPARPGGAPARRAVGRGDRALCSGSSAAARSSTSPARPPRSGIAPRTRPSWRRGSAPSRSRSTTAAWRRTWSSRASSSGSATATRSRPPPTSEAKRLLLEECTAAGSITLARFRDLTGSGRRAAQLLLERFDADGLTRRVGDARVLRRAAKS